VSEGKIRVYGPGPEFKREAVIKTRGGKDAFSVAVDPGGECIAVGFSDTTAVDLALLTSADTRGIDNGNLFEVSWRADGRVLIAGRFAVHISIRPCGNFFPTIGVSVRPARDGGFRAI
jgi:hypothetical protein